MGGISAVYVEWNGCAGQKYCTEKLCILLLALTFNQCKELLMLDFATLQVNLQGKQQCEKELVLLIKASCSILIHFVGHMLNNVSYSLASDGALGRPIQKKGEHERVI